LEGYELLRIERHGRILVATIDNPPVNLLTMPLFGELARLSSELEADPDVLVFVLRSANADFFIAHFDVKRFFGFRSTRRPRAKGATLIMRCASASAR